MITEEKYNELIKHFETKLWDLHREEKEFWGENYPIATKEYLEHCNKYVPSEKAEKELREKGNIPKEDVKNWILHNTRKWTTQKGKIIFISETLKALGYPEVPTKVWKERPDEELVD